MPLTILIITILLVLILSLRTAMIVNKIKDFRRRGVNLTRKNGYYKLVSSIFLSDLPA